MPITPEERMNSGPRLEVEIDFDSRQVKLKMWRALDLAPTPIALPFAMIKNAAAKILEDEAQMEKAGFIFVHPASLAQAAVPDA